MIDSDPPKCWYVFYTYPKYERIIHEYLLGKNYKSFLPMIWITRQWSDRKKRIKVPLFPNYIFIYIERIKIFEILKIPKIIRCVIFDRKPAFLTQKEIDQIHVLLDSDCDFEVVSSLKIGDPVVINEGVLKGIDGILVESRGSNRFAIRIGSIQQSILINVPIDNLEYLKLIV